MNKELISNLISQAKSIANQNFCCKYSNFTVGAALLCQNGTIYTGFNVENHGIESICAERSAFIKALTDGQKEFKAIAVVAKKLDAPSFSKTLPCGYCRQFLSEYTNPEFMIYTYDDEEDKIYSYSIAELLPESFKL